MIAARDLAILYLLHHGYHPPAPSRQDYAQQMQPWAARYQARRDAVERELAAIAAIPREDAPCPPLP